MKSNRKLKSVILITLGIFFAFLPISANNPRFYYNDEINHDNLKISAVSGRIHIDGNSGWAAFRAVGNCTGNGTYSEPYLIEDLIIDGEGTGNGILIENSNVYFRIENCTIFNSGSEWDDGGIKLDHTLNGKLINNNCSFNTNGIQLKYSDNNTIIGNIACNNTNDGISIVNHCDDNAIFSNFMSNNGLTGMEIHLSDNNHIFGNNISFNFIGIRLDNSEKNNISGNILYNNEDMWINLFFLVIITPFRETPQIITTSMGLVYIIVLITPSRETPQITITSMGYVY